MVTCEMEAEIRKIRKFSRIVPPFNPVIPLLGLYPKNLKSAYYSKVTTSVFIAAQFTIA